MPSSLSLMSPLCWPTILSLESVLIKSVTKSGHSALEFSKMGFWSGEEPDDLLNTEDSPGRLVSCLHHDNGGEDQGNKCLLAKHSARQWLQTKRLSSKGPKNPSSICCLEERRAGTKRHEATLQVLNPCHQTTTFTFTYFIPGASMAAPLWTKDPVDKTHLKIHLQKQMLTHKVAQICQILLPPAQ